MTNMEQTLKCGGCGRFYPSLFPCCPFCYVQEFFEVEAVDGECPVCHEVHRTECPECGRKFTEHDTYCLYCGFIRNQPLTADENARGGVY